MMNILLKQAVEQVVETMKNDYIRWSTQDGKKAMSEYSKEVVDNWNIEINGIPP